MFALSCALGTGGDVPLLKGAGRSLDLSLSSGGSFDLSRHLPCLSSFSVMNPSGMEVSILRRIFGLRALSSRFLFRNVELILVWCSGCFGSGVLDRKGFWFVGIGGL